LSKLLKSSASGSIAIGKTMEVEKFPAEARIIPTRCHMHSRQQNLRRLGK